MGVGIRRKVLGGGGRQSRKCPSPVCTGDAGSVILLLGQAPNVLNPEPEILHAELL